MNLRRSLVLITSCALAWSASARPKVAADYYTRYTGFAIPAEPRLPARETHPSLWFRTADLPALKARLNADDFMRTRWAAVLHRADLTVSPPPAPVAGDETKRIHEYYGAMSMAARAHALVALLVDDPAAQAAHRQRAIELLSRAYDGPIFDLDSSVQGSPVDEIYRAAWLQNYAHAYDCVQPSLTPEQDKVIRARLAREAQCVYDNLYVWSPKSPHNHLSKPAWGLGSMALTLSAEPQALAWLGRAIEATNRNTRYFFSGDGIYREGSHYLIFSLTNFLPFLYHYRNVSGVDGFTAFQPVFEAMVEARNSRGWLPNIADSYLRPTPTHLAAVAYRDASTALSSTAKLGAVLQWSYESADLAPFEKERADSGFNYTGASWDYPLEIDELLTHDPTIVPTPPDADPNVFLTGGQTYFRDAWVSHGANQRYLLFHGVANGDNHEHDDHLSFILEAADQMMCSDSGYSRGTYTGGERMQWYVTAAAHNTLTLDNQPATDAAPSQTPPSLFRVNRPGLVGEEKQAFFGKNGDWKRAIFWVAGDYYIVSDRVNATHTGRIASYLHGGRGQLTIDGARRSWSYQDDRYGRTAVLHSWIAAPQATIAEKSGELTYIKGDYAAFPYLETSRTAQHTAWLTLLQPRPAGGKPFEVRDESRGDVSALTITTPDHACLVAAQPVGGKPITVGDVETDGAFALVRRDLSGRVLAFSVLEATTLKVGGREIWHSARPTNAGGVANSGASEARGASVSPPATAAASHQKSANAAPAKAPGATKAGAKKSAATEKTLTALPGAEAFVYRALEPDALRLFVFKPKGWSPTDRRPALVFFFGGGWTHGGPDHAAGWARYAASVGFVGIAPDYRTKNRFGTSPLASVADGRAALRWVEDHAEELGLDPTKIVVGGSSAGGHVALWTAITHTPPGSDPAEAPTIKPRALILMSAVSDTAPDGLGYTPKRFGEDAVALSPVDQLDAQMPPMIVFHGNADHTVPYAQAEALHAKLVGAGNTCQLVTVPGGDHNFSSQLPEWKDKARTLIRGFLQEQKLLPEGPSHQR
ncbi:alpha/beta hydrolase fold domain-containing protein [Horticoccus luteus]|uniref:Alpha/beta hydrolase fold domain-containing protein n=1 Tax=Horticoccus luteus TaxID=2862869 RepID=A0A8F9TTI5_9BACT|nr:alpha/beta hydrolase fold domain-containing protein [Horticoccus luteus]QYM78974.1 alpha/beta hydrolase fold domain-containing protein [Horticoccus luteus]